MAVPAGTEPLVVGDPEAVGPYHLAGRLGIGGMGTVYYGHAPDGRPVAVKVIRREFAAEPEFRARFLREAKAARRVARFCTAEVLDVDVDGDEPYLVTEYIEGPTLSARVRADGPLAPADLERLAVAVGNALTAIHAAKLIHRDLKPGNILLSSSGARVIDFGIARAMESTTLHTRQRIMGTPAFMAPEQALGYDLTPAADIYAWGGVVLFAATGRTPYGEAATPVILYRAVHEEPDFTGLDGGLLPLVRQAMSKDPAARPSAHELLVRLAGGQAGPGAPPAAVAPSPYSPPGYSPPPYSPFLSQAAPSQLAPTQGATPSAPPSAFSPSASPATGSAWPGSAPVARTGTRPDPTAVRVARPDGSRRSGTRLAVVVAALAVAGALVGLAVALDPFGQRGGGEPLAVTSADSQAPTGATPSEPAGGATGAPTEAVRPPREWFVFKRYDGVSSVNDSPIVVVDPDGAERQVGSGDSPDLSPDGGRIAYASVNGQIMTVLPDGSDERTLTNYSDRSAEYPAWSPDGASIAYFVNTGGLFVVAADGTGQRQVAAVDGLEASWSATGEEIVFRDPDEQQLRIVSVADGSVRALTGTPRPGEIPVEPSWSPDGAMILFSTSAGGIYAIAPDGSGQRQLAGSDTWHPTWSPDGEVLFVRDGTVGDFFAASGAVETMKPDGSAARPVRSITASGPVRWVREPAPSGS